MQVITALFKFSPQKSIQFIAWGILGAMLKTILFVLLNEFVTALSRFEKKPWLFVIALSVLGCNILVEFLYYKRAANLIQAYIQNLKEKLAKTLNKTELLDFEALGENHVFSTVAQYTAMLSLLGPYLSTALLQGQLAAIFMFIYIGIQAPIAAIISIIWLVAFGTFIFQRLGRPLSRIRKAFHGSKKHYLEKLDHLLKGFKEISVNQHKKQAVLLAHDIQAMQSAKLLQKTIYIDRLRSVYMDPFFLGLLAVLVFVIGMLAGEGYQATALSIVILMLMLMRSVYHILISFEDWNMVKHSIDMLESLQTELKKNQTDLEIPNFTQKSALQHGLELKNISFTYPHQPAKPSYGIGPINLKIQKGECIFIVGGNGTGKSTLLKVITQLYTAQKGRIYQDDIAIGLQNVKQYQQLFSTIFTDFHLFEQLYSIEKINQEHIEYLLQLFGIEQHVLFDGSHFQFTGLSTGQKKRLAMLQVFLENRAVYIFDEVAADQDPNYRKFFYEIVLNDLKQLNKTVIAVSHDDHYFHVADRVLEMKNGQLHNYSPSKPKAT
ncbi:MAG: ATP-binding cassette domain-containing protein [Flammeovirgaceae bacterium]